MTVDAATAADPTTTTTEIPVRPHLTAAEQEVLGAGLTDTNIEALDAEAARVAATSADAEAARVAAEQAAIAAAAEQARAAEAAALAAAEAARAAGGTANAAAAAAVANAAPVAPTPPKDFGAELKALGEQYNDAELDVVEYNQKIEALRAEQTAFDKLDVAHTAKLAVWEAQQASLQTQAVSTATAAWNADAVAWQAQNPDFISDPARVKAMADNLPIVDAKNPGLTNQQLLAKAYAMTVAETGYISPAGKPQINPEQALKDALNARKPDLGAIPTTLGNAPAGGAIDARVSDSFAALDALPIDKLESFMARMTDEQRDAYLRDAPGANATGRE